MPQNTHQPAPQAPAPAPTFGHARSYPPFEWPCLTAHIMMRLEPDADPVTETSPTIIDARAEARTNAINSAIDKFRGRSDDPPEMRFAFPPQLTRRGQSDFPRSGKTSSKASLPLSHSLCVPLKAFGHFKMSLIVEAMPEATAFSLRATPMRPEDAQCDGDTKTVTQAAYEVLQTLMKQDAPPGDAADRLLDAFYEGFWDAYFDHITGVKAHPGESARIRLFSAMGEVVVEFHGAILSARRKSDNTFETLDDQITQGEVRLEKLNARQGQFIVIPPDHNDLEGIQATLKDFLNARPVFFSTALKLVSPQPPASQRTDGNAVLCFLDDGYALYGSTLRMDKHRIVRFFMLYGGASRHHLSRLVMTLHHCGELRIASTFDAQYLSAVSEMIRVVDLKLGGEEPAPLAALEQETSDLTKLVRGGLSFRIARLTQHTQLLQHFLADLHVKRVPGWQSYEGFIKRNISRELDHYVELGRRFEQLQRRIRLAATRQSTEAMSERTRRLVELQIGAEVIGLLAVSYYLASAVAKIARGYSPTDGLSALEEAHIYVGTFAGVLFARLMVWLVMRWLRLRDLARAKRERERAAEG